MIPRRKSRSIPTDWLISTVGSACTIRNDLRMPISRDVRATQKGKYPYYGPTGILGSINEYRLDGMFALIGEDGDHFLDYTNKAQTLLVTGKFNVNNHAHVIESSDFCDAEWFYNYFRHRNIKRNLTRQGAGRYKLNKVTLESIPILIPPKKEQIVINALFRTWDAAIEKTVKLIEAKEKRFSWLLKRLIDQGMGNGEWRRVKLGEVVEINKGQQLNVADMVDTGKYYALNGGIEPSGFTNNWNTPKNTITISEGGNSCGFVNFNTEKFWCGGHCYALNNLSSEVSHKYLYHFLKAHEQLLMALRVGSGLPNIQKKDLLNITVTFPPLCEQNIIAEILNTARQEIDLLKKQVEAYRKQKRGLMQKLLTGQWRVKVD